MLSFNHTIQGAASRRGRRSVSSARDSVRMCTGVLASVRGRRPLLRDLYIFAFMYPICSHERCTRTMRRRRHRAVWSCKSAALARRAGMRKSSGGPGVPIDAADREMFTRKNAAAGRRGKASVGRAERLDPDARV